MQFLPSGLDKRDVFAMFEAYWKKTEWEYLKLDKIQYYLKNYSKTPIPSDFKKESVGKRFFNAVKKELCSNYNEMNAKIEDKRLWVFRLTVDGYEGEGEGTCDLDVDREEVMRYWKTESQLIDKPYYDKYNLNIELQEKGKLRQGWGLVYNDMNLDLNQPRAKWVENFMKLGWKVWGEKNNCKIAGLRWNILITMKNMRVGEIIFIPRTPTDGSFTVATIKKEYYFQKFNGFLGHGHVIEVEKKRNFNYGSQTLEKVDFRTYRKAIAEIKEKHDVFPKIENFINKNYS